MKKASLCIGAFLFLFLMFSIHTAQAQPFPALEQMNGKWLKMNGSVNGWLVTAYQADVQPEKLNAPLSSMYACVYYFPGSTSANLEISDHKGIQIGIGSLTYDGGTVDQWLAYMSLSLDSKGDYTANGDDITLWAYGLAKMKNGAEKGSFNSYGMNGYIDNAAEYGNLGGKLKAKIVDKVPWDGGTCRGYEPL
jgi:hypothetical protein